MEENGYRTRLLVPYDGLCFFEEQIAGIGVGVVCLSGFALVDLIVRQTAPDRVEIEFRQDPQGVRGTNDRGTEYRATGITARVFYHDGPGQIDFDCPVDLHLLGEESEGEFRASIRYRVCIFDALGGVTIEIADAEMKPVTKAER